MGDDLAGSKVGEGFEFALDMSDNIDSQPFLLFHDQGTMVVTIMSEVLQAFLDDAPFCCVPQEVSVFRTLLMQDTCRDGDDLVENKTVCSEQSVFKNGEFQACSWNSISITDSPTTAVPSNVPSSAPAIAPSIELSMVPSIDTSSFLSMEIATGPSIVPALNDMISVVPTAAPTAQLAAYGSLVPTSSSVKPSSQPFMPATIESVYSSEVEGDSIIPLATNKDSGSTDSLAGNPSISSTENLGVAGSIVGLIVVALCDYFCKKHFCGKTKELIPKNDYIITLS
mmetsp:Transcript_40317/g.43745  ORF Transcript_40317/g.43745 Transcript_40317/m.43745 type:complete len:283 (-) Transcript_40317:81-929(-)